MGNQQPSSSLEEFEIMESSSPVRRAVNKHTRQRYEFISLLPSKPEHLQARLKLRANTPSPHLTTLSHFWVKDEFASCGGKPQFDIFFKQSTPLEQYLTYRRVRGEGFSVDEVEYVIVRVGGALRELKEMGEEYGCVNLGNVGVEGGEVRVRDPLVGREEEGWVRRCRKIQGFPSPQKLYTLFDSLSSFDEHTSDLFSLGMLALQLTFPHQHLSQLYKNTSSHYLNCTIDLPQLRRHISDIQNHSLREWISVLTHEQSTKRLGIYEMMKGRKFDKARLRLLQENPYEMTQGGNDAPQIINAPRNPQDTQVEFKPTQVLQKIQANPQMPFVGLPRIPKPIPFAPNTYQPYIPFQPSPPFPTTSEIWKPTKIYESSLKNVSEESSFTPINKISDANINSFKSTKFHYPLMTTTQSFINHGVERVLPKYIDTTYRTSFITFGETGLVTPTLIVPKETQSIPLSQPKPQSTLPNIENNNKQEIPKPTQQLNSKDKSPADSLNNLMQSLPTPSQQIQPKEQGKSAALPQQQQSPQQDVLNSIGTPYIATEQQEGFVVEEFGPGTRYQGQKKNGMRNGQGQFIYKEGSKYKGQWKDNKMQGYGVLYYPSGVVAYQGEWKNDQFHGYGTVYNDNPTPVKGGFDFTNFNSLDEQWVKYEGELRNDAKEGRGKLQLTNGECYIGGFVNDMVEGQGQFRRSNGAVVRGIWGQGLLKRILYQ